MSGEGSPCERCGERTVLATVTYWHVVRGVAVEEDLCIECEDEVAMLREQEHAADLCGRCGHADHESKSCPFVDEHGRPQRR